MTFKEGKHRFPLEYRYCDVCTELFNLSILEEDYFYIMERSIDNKIKELVNGYYLS